MKNGSESVVHGSIEYPEQQRIEHRSKFTNPSLVSQWRYKAVARIDAIAWAIACVVPAPVFATAPLQGPIQQNRPTQYKE